MIRAAFHGRRVTVCGHAGYAPEGRDIVCAAVSALVYALAEYLEETGQAAQAEVRKGYAEIRGTGDCGPAFAMTRCGLRQLAQAYPGCVEVTGS